MMNRDIFRGGFSPPPLPHTLFRGEGLGQLFFRSANHGYCHLHTSKPISILNHCGFLDVCYKGSAINVYALCLVNWHNAHVMLLVTKKVWEIMENHQIWRLPRYFFTSVPGTVMEKFNT